MRVRSPANRTNGTTIRMLTQVRVRLLTALGLKGNAMKIGSDRSSQQHHPPVAMNKIFTLRPAVAVPAQGGISNQSTVEAMNIKCIIYLNDSVLVLVSFLLLPHSPAQLTLYLICEPVNALWMHVVQDSGSSGILCCVNGGLRDALHQRLSPETAARVPKR